MSVGLVVSVLMNKQLRVELVAFVNLVWSRFGFTHSWGLKEFHAVAGLIPCQ